ncbi:hypothetical protein KVH27_27960 [Streptomyces olivaceus]|uniref:hypothetical protein n=1 Tax=Streptomyces olivaceus TaxID=47716 RepID=UPI001CCB2CBE|nr:hypothetical protein [Streptomyces olivaceus]MBZ6252187.1 hypothetical protein [Streptomyces olivaceus]
MSTFTPQAAHGPLEPAEQAAQQDRAWFQAHPDATGYRRATVRGEHGPGLYFDGGRTHVTQAAPGLYLRVGQFCAFDDPDAVAVARTPQWRPWTAPGGSVPPEIAAADAMYRTPAAQAVLAVLEAEDTIRSEQEGSAS